MIIEPNLDFDPNLHRYTYTKGGTKVLTSDTTAIKMFSKPFDPNEYAPKIAERDGVTVGQVLAKWSEKQKKSSDLGTFVHQIAETVVEHSRRNAAGFVTIPLSDTRGCKQLTGLYKWFMEHLEIFYGDLKPELRICWPEAGLAGTIDLLAYNYNGGEVTIIDYKTNESLNMHGTTTCCTVSAREAEAVGLQPEKADEMHVQIRVKPTKKLQIEADRDKMKQVLLNLLSNGIKYNKPDGTVTLSAQANGNEIILTVADTGVGIPADALPYLFQKFYRVRDTDGKVSGTGLGLSICKQIVQGHRGTINVHSQVRKGTIFTIHLPQK